MTEQTASAAPAKTAGQTEVSAVILAGGQGRRMGGQDKGWVLFRNRPMIEHVLAQTAPQVAEVMINANRSLERYQALGYPVIADLEAGFHGPLMGMLTGLTHAGTDWVLFVPCDTPLLPDDLAERLLKAALAEQAEIAVVHDGERLQPVIALIRRDLQPSLQAWLAAGKRKIDHWYAQHRMASVLFDAPKEQFFNLNTDDEVRQLEQGL